MFQVSLARLLPTWFHRPTSDGVDSGYGKQRLRAFPPFSKNKAKLKRSNLIIQQ